MMLPHFLFRSLHQVYHLSTLSSLPFFSHSSSPSPFSSCCFPRPHLVSRSLLLLSFLLPFDMTTCSPGLECPVLPLLKLLTLRDNQMLVLLMQIRVIRQ